MELKIIKLIKTITILLIISLVSSIFTSAYAVEVSSTGTAKIRRGMTAAYLDALNDSMIGAIRWYYKENQIKDIEVTNEFTKFVKGFEILESNLINDNTTIQLRLKIDLDEDSLKNAKFMIKQHADSVVYYQGGIPSEYVSYQNVQNTINKVLISNSFDLKNLDDFLSKIEDYDANGYKKAFKKTGSDYLFLFNFQPVEQGQYKDQDNLCELLTTVEIVSKKDGAKTLQVTTGSKLNNTNYCYQAAVKEAISSTVQYVRENIIKLPETSLKLQEYKIKFINFTNMVNTKNIMDMLKNKGFIKNFKTLSYSQNTVEFNVQTYFPEEDLISKVIDKDNSAGIKFKISRGEISIDLNKNDSLSNINSLDNTLSKEPTE